MELSQYSDWTTGWTTRVRFLAGAGILLLVTASKPALGLTHPPIQFVPRALTRGIKRPEREGHNSIPSSVEVKNAWRYTSTSPYVFMTLYLIKYRVCVLKVECLVKHRGNFTFYSYQIADCPKYSESVKDEDTGSLATRRANGINSRHTEMPFWAPVDDICHYCPFSGQGTLSVCSHLHKGRM
jgi:hypothetical protein